MGLALGLLLACLCTLSLTGSFRGWWGGGGGPANTQQDGEGGKGSCLPSASVECTEHAKTGQFGNKLVCVCVSISKLPQVMPTWMPAVHPLSISAPSRIPQCFLLLFAPPFQPSSACISFHFPPQPFLPLLPLLSHQGSHFV